MPRSPCLEVGCSGFATYRGRCENHAPAREAETHRPKRRRSTPADRGTPAHLPARIYQSKRWRLLRLKVLRAHPICQACGDELATQVDHVQAIEDGGNPWAIANLQALCSSCHSRKTMAEVRARTY